MQPSAQRLIIYAVIGVVFIGLIAFRMQRMMRATPFDPYRAWIFPVLFIALSASSLFSAQPTGLEWLWVAGTFALGLVLGYFRGASISMTVDPATHRIMAQGSAMAMLFIVVLIVARVGLTYLLKSEANAIALRPIMATVLPSVLGAGLFVARGIEMGLRGHRMLQAAKALPPPALTDAP